LSPSPKRPRRKGTVYEKTGALVAGTATQGRVAQWRDILARRKRVTVDEETGNIVTIDKETGDVTVTVSAARAAAYASHGATEARARHGGVETTIRRFAGWATTKTKPKVARIERWQEGVARKRVELETEYERDCNLGLNGHRPTDWEATISFAYDAKDLPAHYYLADGSLDPKLERPAADLISTAIKRLQIAQTKYD
jgi:hypothetical protein